MLWTSLTVQKMMDDEIYREGYEAYKEGLTLDDNPYKNDRSAGKFDALVWTNGWYDSHTDQMGIEVR